MSRRVGFRQGVAVDCGHFRQRSPAHVHRSILRVAASAKIPIVMLVDHGENREPRDADTE
jgi:hypothetical protein